MRTGQNIPFFLRHSPEHDIKKSSLILDEQKTLNILKTHEKSRITASLFTVQKKTLIKPMFSFKAKLIIIYI